MSLLTELVSYHLKLQQLWGDGLDGVRQRKKITEPLMGTPRVTCQRQCVRPQSAAREATLHGMATRTYRRKFGIKH
jgi:hypothetical protein